MRRRSFFTRLGLGTLFIGAASTSKLKAKNTDEIDIQKGEFVHMVFFWLKDPSNEDARSKFEKELFSFIDYVPGIARKHIGHPANTNRSVIDSTYTYSLVLSFKTKVEHDAYQEHQLHKQFIENASSLWEKVQVYDSEILS